MIYKTPGANNVAAAFIAIACFGTLVALVIGYVWWEWVT